MREKYAMEVRYVQQVKSTLTEILTLLDFKKPIKTKAIKKVHKLRLALRDFAELYNNCVLVFIFFQHQQGIKKIKNFLI